MHASIVCASDTQIFPVLMLGVRTHMKRPLAFKTVSRGDDVVLKLAWVKLLDDRA